LAWVFPERRQHLLEVGQGPWRIGRGLECEIPIEDRLASREHARLSRKGPLIVLEDLDSRNGTFAQGVSVRQVPIGVGTVVRVGNWVGILVETSAALASEPRGLDELLPGYFAGPALKRILEPARRAARSQLPILLQGVTGAGKERVAEYIHASSGRSGPFYPVNCATIPPEVAESELFGHRAGAFTGAKAGHIGHFRAAHGGTLFLDEVSELPRPVQAKLLRAVQEQKVTALGDTTPIPIDVRIVASCQRPLLESVTRGEFREDLQARLSGLVVNVPTLCERIEEVPALFMRLLERHTSNSAGRALPAVDGKLIERLCLHAWPQNVRELELLCRQLLAVHGDAARLTQSHLPKGIGAAKASPETGARRPDASTPDGDTAEENAKRLREIERLVRALRETGGNITRASALLGISRASAYRMMAGQSIPELLARYAPGAHN
jgi:sigma-54 dependent transcriptional regulator, acetoin dehydrogenase operon transcriptional activator AcoR